VDRVFSVKALDTFKKQECARIIFDSVWPIAGDTSASARYFKQDITTPFVMEDGYLSVPNKPGIGVKPDMDFLESITKSKEIIV